MNIAIGQLLDEEGLASQLSQQVVADRQRGFDVRTRKRHWATRARDVRRVQSARINVTHEHDPVVLGQIAHLEHRGRHLWCVAELPGEEIDPEQLPELYFSVATDSRRDYTDVEITAVGLVE